jgi:hypothetical protein
MVKLKFGELDADIAGFVKKSQLVFGELGRDFVD